MAAPLPIWPGGTPRPYNNLYILPLVKIHCFIRDICAMDYDVQMNISCEKQTVFNSISFTAPLSKYTTHSQ